MHDKKHRCVRDIHILVRCPGSISLGDLQLSLVLKTPKARTPTFPKTQCGRGMPGSSLGARFLAWIALGKVIHIDRITGGNIGARTTLATIREGIHANTQKKSHHLFLLFLVSEGQIQTTKKLHKSSMLPGGVL